MGERLRALYEEVVSRPEVKRALVLRAMSPGSRAFHESGCMTTVGLWLLLCLGVSCSSQVLPYWLLGVLVAVPILVTLWFFWLDGQLVKKPYSGPVVVRTGVVESVETRSSSGGEYTMSLVHWREAHQIDPDGACRRLAFSGRKTTVLDLGARQGQTVRQVVVEEKLLANVPEVVFPESDLNPDSGEPIPSPVPRGLAVVRTRFFEAAEREFRTSSFSALSLDLDDLKKCNAELGTEAGDWWVAHAAREIRRAVGPSSNVGHCGGDEFSVTLPVPLEQAVEVAERVRRLFSEAWMAPGKVTLSIGVAADRPTLVELLKAADEALQEAKREGKNQVRASGGSTEGASKVV